jgi:hypothetical protein
MVISKRQGVRMGTVFVLFTLFAVHPILGAQNHVVSPAEMQKEAVAATHTRQQNVEMVTQFLSSAQAKQALQSARVDPTQVKNAVSTLSDEDVAQLAARADKAQADFAAGKMSDRDMIWLILAVVVLILVIIAVR